MLDLKSVDMNLPAMSTLWSGYVETLQPPIYCGLALAKMIGDSLNIVVIFA